MEKVFADVGDTVVQIFNFGLGLLPIVTEFDFAACATLVTAQANLMHAKTVDGFDMAAVAQRGEPGNADIDSNRSALCNCMLYRSLGLDRYKPFAMTQANSHVTNFA